MEDCHGYCIDFKWGDICEQVMTPPSWQLTHIATPHVHSCLQINATKRHYLYAFTSLACTAAFQTKAADLHPARKEHRLLPVRQNIAWAVSALLPASTGDGNAETHRGRRGLQ